MRTRHIGTATIALVAKLPLSTLIMRAAADRWYGRALFPQEVGLRGLEAALNTPTIIKAIVGSVVVAILVAIVSVSLAWPAARYLSDSGHGLMWAVLAAPVLLPPLMLGDGLSPWLLRIGLGEGRVGIVVAHLALAIPYATLALLPAFGRDLDELDESASLVGASAGHRLANVVLPAARRHVALSVALAFTVSWSQYATSLTVGGGTPMLPLVLVPYMRSDPQIASVLSLIFLLPPVLAIGIAARVGSHRLGNHGGPVVSFRRHGVSRL